MSPDQRTGLRAPDLGFVLDLSDDASLAWTGEIYGLGNTHRGFGSILWAGIWATQWACFSRQGCM
jgi:hypothetical protein